VNPGKHNIFDFYRMAVSSSSGILNTSRDRRAHPVWDFLNDDGYRTGIMNIPMTFPPDTVDGFFISGFPYGESGSATTGYTYPPKLEQELQEAGPYPLDPFGEGIVAGSEAPFLKRLQHTFDRQSEEAKRLMRRKDWDLFWVVFTGVDKSQHFFWKFQDPEHPEYDPGLAEMYGGVIRDFYINADRAIGEMLEIAKDGIAKFDKETALYLRPMFWAETGFVRADRDSTRFCFTLFEAPLPAADGFSVTLSKYIRPLASMAPTKAKASCLYPNSGRALGEAQDKGFDNAVVLDGLGLVAELATANLWIGKDGAAHTPAANGTFLSGITRQRVISLLKGAGIPVYERPITWEEVLDADEAFSTGNYGKVMPINKIESRDLQPGPICQKARELYWDWAHK